LLIKPVVFLYARKPHQTAYSKENGSSAFIEVFEIKNPNIKNVPFVLVQNSVNFHELLYKLFYLFKNTLQLSTNCVDAKFRNQSINISR